MTAPEGSERRPSSSRTADAPAASAPRQELLRALAAVVLSPPGQGAPAAESLGLPAPTPAEHTGVFILSAPPHAAIYCGEEGKLGGDAADRVAGFWRVLGLTPPADVDHLGVLLMLAAELGDAADSAQSPQARAKLTHSRDTLIWEHLWSWAGPYLGMVARLGTPALGPWAHLTLAAIAREVRMAAPAAMLPLALRAAPPTLTAGRLDRASLLDAVLAPVRSGLLLSRDDLRVAAQAVGAGYRMGERRYTLAAMLDQDAAGTLDWLTAFARQQATWHLDLPAAGGPDLRRWWAERAASTAEVLDELQRELVAAS